MSSKELYYYKDLPDITQRFTELLKDSENEMRSQYMIQMTKFLEINTMNPMSSINAIKWTYEKYSYFKDEVKPGWERDFKSNKFWPDNYPNPYFKIWNTIVGRDFMGNMNYGYAWKAGWIPDPILIPAWSIAQIAYDYTPRVWWEWFKLPTPKNVWNTIKNEYNDTQSVIKWVLLYENHKWNIDEAIVSHYVESSIPTLLKETVINKIDKAKSSITNQIWKVKNWLWL